MEVEELDVLQLRLNTFLTSKVLKNYFMFPHVGRMDDIWASYYAEAQGATVVYNKASVYQDRFIYTVTQP